MVGPGLGSYWLGTKVLTNESSVWWHGREYEGPADVIEVILTGAAGSAASLPADCWLSAKKVNLKPVVATFCQSGGQQLAVLQCHSITLSTYYGPMSDQLEQKLLWEIMCYCYWLLNYSLTGNMNPCRLRMTISWIHKSKFKGFKMFLWSKEFYWTLSKARN